MTALSQSDFPSYEQVAIALMNSQADVMVPAEAHGLLSGIICAKAGKKNTGKKIAKELFNSADTTFINLYQHTFAQFEDMHFSFRLLLPDDEQPLSLRAEALSQWCQGFLGGLGLGGVELVSGKTTETTEALSSLSEIARLNYDEIETTEEDEFAFNEAIEFVRLAVMTVYNEILDFYTGSGDASHYRTLH